MLKKLFYPSLHLSVHLLESLRLGQPARAHSSTKDARSDMRLEQSIAEALFSTWPLDTSSYDLQKKGHSFFPMMNILGMEIPPKKKKKRVLMSASFLPTACAHWCFHGVPLMGGDIICLKKAPQKVEKVNINCLIQFEGCVHSVSGSARLKG